MFTGIVTDVGRIAAVSSGERLRRIRIESAYEPATIALGASIACGGPCLTVVAVGEARRADAGSRSMPPPRPSPATTCRNWKAGTRVNLERSLKIGDELGGHIVTGHVDGVADHSRPRGDHAGRRSLGADRPLRHPRAARRLPASSRKRARVCLDGTSLTVNRSTDDVFSVLIIPHTLAVTTWGERTAGDRLNLEVDLMARYAARLAEARAAG